ncbi:MAG: hypothetical protein E6J34_16995 [Chloroflexi bacterium]|nr:MAG: hypothetical protein E6J34_16995 [Chloroflexota bacterium]
MGVERSVTRWYVLRDTLLYEIAGLEAQLASSQESVDTATTEDNADVQQQLAKAQERLRTLGPCPKPMMG